MLPLENKSAPRVTLGFLFMLAMVCGTGFSLSIILLHAMFPVGFLAAVMFAPMFFGTCFQRNRLVYALAFNFSMCTACLYFNAAKWESEKGDFVGSFFHNLKSHQIWAFIYLFVLSSVLSLTSLFFSRRH